MIYISPGFFVNTALLRDLDSEFAEVIKAISPPPEDAQESIQRRLLGHRERIHEESAIRKEGQKKAFYQAWVNDICSHLNANAENGQSFTKDGIRSLHKLIFPQGVRAKCQSSAGKWHFEKHTAGIWRKSQMWATVNGVSYPYIASEDVEPAINSLIQWQSIDDKISALAKTIFTYFVFCEIHPFSDGNGTVALLLVDTQLRQLRIPVNWIAIFNSWTPEVQLLIFKSIRTGDYKSALQLIQKSSAAPLN